MLLHVFHTLGTAAMISATAGSAGTLLPAALLLCIVVLVVGGLRFRALWTAHGEQARELANQSEAAKGSAGQLQKLRSDLDEKQRELQTLRQEAGAQRKKNHTLQDDIKRLRATVKDETERRIAAQNTRPAFAEPAAPKIVVEAPPAESAAAATAPAAATAVAPGPGPSELALQAQIKTLEAELLQQKKTIGDERTQSRGLKDELKKLRKRGEDLRRIDIITKSKMEVLEDKLRHLGRAHYEAISEVALLKGEVQPPRPKEAPRRASAFEAPDLADNETEPTGDEAALADGETALADGDADDFEARPPHDAPSVAQQVSLQ